ncbi:hypothetical protein WDU94_001665 [Cyamophila willieti]
MFTKRFRAILSKYENQQVIPSLTQVHAAQNRIGDDQEMALRRDIETMDEQLKILQQAKQADKDYLIERSVAIIEDNEKLSKAMDDMTKKINRFMARARLTDPNNSEKKLVQFLESENSIRAQYAHKIAQMEKENAALVEQIEQVRALR